MKKKAKKKKRNRQKSRRFSLFYKVIALILLLSGSLVGYDYYDAGNLERTYEVLKMAEQYAGEFVDLAGVWGEEADSFLRSLLPDNTENYASLETIPEYSGQPYVTINDNIPIFSEEQRKAGGYEYYSELDYLGRCGYAEANITPELMPTEERGAIGSVKPTGWHTVKYEGIDGNYLYNRCHLIGYQLTGENANVKNLITGTRYLNVEGMLPWENVVADYIQKTGDTVMYRVTPYYKGTNLVASGVSMEAESLGSDEICFHIFVFNAQPGIGIDYTNGDSWIETQ